MLDQNPRLLAGRCLGVAPRLHPDFLGRICKLLKGMAGTTGLEPAASAVTGQRSNQLNYVPTRHINEMEITSVDAAWRNVHKLPRLPKLTRISGILV